MRRGAGGRPDASRRGRRARLCACLDARLGAAGAEAHHPDAGGVAWGLRQGVKKPTAGSRPPSAKRKTFCGPAAISIRHFMAASPPFAVGNAPAEMDAAFGLAPVADFSAAPSSFLPNADGKPQYRAPAAQVAL